MVARTAACKAHTGPLFSGVALLEERVGYCLPHRRAEPASWHTLLVAGLCRRACRQQARVLPCTCRRPSGGSAWQETLARHLLLSFLSAELELRPGKKVGPVGRAGMQGCHVLVSTLTSVYSTLCWLASRIPCIVALRCFFSIIEWLALGLLLLLCTCQVLAIKFCEEGALISPLPSPWDDSGIEPLPEM